MSKMLEVALAYRKLNWSVLPLHPGKKIPHVLWKPLQTQLPTEAEIKEWFTKWPKAQIGVVTGKISNLVVIDFDSANALDRFRALYDLPETIMQTTGRGSQYLFAYPKDTKVKNQAGILKKVDVRGEGGLVVLPPSKHKTGKHYKWGHINPIEDGLDDLLDLTPELIKLCQNKPVSETKTVAGSKNKPGWVDEALMGVNQGQRNQTCAKLAGYYLRVLKGDIEGTFVILKDWNQRFNKPPLDDKEIRKIVESIGARQGLDELAEILRTDIYQMEVLNYPDHTVFYRFYIDGLDKHIILSSDDISSPRKFRSKVVRLTKRMMKSIKEKDWFDLIDKVLVEATEIQMEEDETNLAVIRRIITSNIKCGEHDDPAVYIENAAVIYQDKIHLYLGVVMQQLQFQSIRMNRKELGSLLRIMKFARKTTRMHKKVLETWQIKKIEFFSHLTILENA